MEILPPAFVMAFHGPKSLTRGNCDPTVVRNERSVDHHKHLESFSGDHKYTEYMSRSNAPDQPSGNIAADTHCHLLGPVTSGAKVNCSIHERN